MKKLIKGYTSKTGFYFTIDVETGEAFRALAEEKSVNKSKLIEKLMKNWIEENK